MQSELTIDPKTISDLVGKSLANPAVQLKEWHIEKLSGGLELGSAIYRLSGTAKVGDSDKNWSLIIKAIQPNQAQADPAGCHFWKRDPMAYQSGILYSLPAEVTAPRCIEVRENADGSIWLCLEEIKDEHPRPWSLERYAQAARQLGAFNGAYLAGQALPDDSWITQDWLRKYLDEAVPMVDFIRQNPTHPIVKVMLPGITLPMTLAVWEEIPRILKRLGGMPKTFCHQDAFEKNLFYRGSELVLIDWNFAGLAPVGTELAALVGASFGLAKFPVSQAKELDQACFKNYLEGLRQAGYQPDSRQVRLCYCLTLTLRYVIGATVGEMLPGLLNQATRDHWVEGMQESQDYAGESDPGIVAYYTAIYMEGLKGLGLWSLLRVAARTVFHTIRLVGKRRARVASPGEQAS